MPRARRTPPPSPRRVALGRALLQARLAAGHESGSQFAALLGWHQTKLSRIETGDRLPTESEVEAFAEFVGADPAPLLDLFEQATTTTLRAAVNDAGVVIQLQQELTRLEVGSSAVAEFQPTLVPGLAQTADYAREWLTHPNRPNLNPDLDVEEVVETRLDRQRQVLDGSRQVIVAINEVVLQGVYGTEEVLRGQLAHLRRLVDERLIELYVVPTARPMATLGGFELLDDVVSLEDFEGLRLLAAPRVVDIYRRTLDAIKARALPGPTALLNP